jgi:hypothetical protein
MGVPSQECKKIPIPINPGEMAESAAHSDHLLSAISLASPYLTKLFVPANSNQQRQRHPVVLLSRSYAKEAPPRYTRLPILSRQCPPAIQRSERLVQPACHAARKQRSGATAKGEGADRGVVLLMARIHPDEDMVVRASITL